MCAAREDSNVAHFFLAVDTAGILHCYRYLEEEEEEEECDWGADDGDVGRDDEGSACRAARLVHLWSRGMHDAPTPGALANPEDTTSPVKMTNSSSASKRRERLGFYCLLSKRLRSLPHSSVTTILPHAAADEGDTVTPTYDGKSSPYRLGVFGNTRKNGVLSAAALLRPAESEKCEASADAANIRGHQKGSTVSLRVPPEETDGTKGVPESASPNSTTSCPFCTFSAAQAAGQYSNSNAIKAGSPLSSTSNTRHKELFHSSDFMARLLPLENRSMNRIDMVPLEEKNISDTEWGVQSPSQAGSAAAEVLWYWRCPRSLLDAASPPSSSAQQSRLARKKSADSSFANNGRAYDRSRRSNDTAVVSSNQENDNIRAPHVWLPLPQAVRFWNSFCCFHHRLLSLGNTRETFREFDLLSGTPIGCAVGACDFGDAASETSSCRSVQASPSSISTDGSGCTTPVVGREDGTQFSTSEAAKPREVLSLTVQRFETLLIQTPASHSCTSAPDGQKRSQGTRRCIATLVAHTTQVTVRCGAARRRPCSASYDTLRDSTEESYKHKSLSPSSSPPPPLSPVHSARRRSHHSSTSASDIDMDILSGRKRPQSPSRLKRSASSSSSSSSATTESSGFQEGGNESVAADHQSTGGSPTTPRQLTNEIPLRCGPDGCVYAVRGASSVSTPVAARRSHSTASGSAARRQREASRIGKPLLQLRSPLVEAFWIALPSATRNLCNTSFDSSLVRGIPRRPPGTSCSNYVEVQPVPWMPCFAFQLRTAESCVRHPPRGTFASEAGVGAETVSTRGFLLEGVSQEVPVSPPPLVSYSGDCPRIFRPLSAYDLRHAVHGTARHSGTPPHETHASDHVRHTEDHLTNVARGTNARGEERQLDVPHRTRHRSSSKSSVQGSNGSSFAHRFSAPPRRFIPASSFFDDNFEPLLLLGHGVGGAVLLTRHRVTGVFYAVKVLIVRDYESERDILQELRVHAMLEHRHIARYHACWSEVISATRAQQLAFIGLCHPEEAQLPRRGRVDSVASSSTTLQASHRGAPALIAADRERGNSWWSSPSTPAEKPSGRTRLRSAPGGWKHLMIPSQMGVTLMGSESASEMVTPTAKRTQSGSGFGRNPWSSAIVDEYVSSDGVNSTEEEDEASEMESREILQHQRRSTQDITSAFPSSPLNGSRKIGAVIGPASHLAMRSPLEDTTALSSHPQSLIMSSASQGRPTRVGHVQEGNRPERAVRSDFTSPFSGTDDTETSEESDNWTGVTAADDAAPPYRTVIGSRAVFLQMELCQVTLAHFLATRTEVDRVENLIILRQLVAGLRYLHQRGILHRDVKPSNVFLDYRCQYDEIDPVECPSSDFSDGDTQSTSWSSMEGNAVHDPQGSDETEQTLSSTLMAHRRRLKVPFRQPPPATGATSGPVVSCRSHTWQHWHLNESFSPVMGLKEGEVAAASLDNRPSWEDSRAALDLLLRKPLENSSDMVYKWLLRHPISSRGEEAWGAMLPTMNGGEQTEALAKDTALKGPVRETPRRRELKRLEGWLRNRLVQVRLGDFGLAKFFAQQGMQVNGFEPTNESNTVGAGSPLYASPEQLKGSRCTPASDAFALGVILAEVYLQPKTIAERLTVLREVRDGVYHEPALLAQFPELKLVRRLTATDPARRMSLAAVQKALRAHLLNALQAKVRQLNSI